MKNEKRESVLYQWVCELPFTQQAVLLLALRGPDGLPKQTPAKQVLHYLRGMVCKPAYPEFNGECDGFMRTDYGDRIPSHETHSGYQGQIEGHTEEVPFGWKFVKVVDAFYKDIDVYPMHFLMHLLHAAEIVGYHYTDHRVAKLWLSFYQRGVEQFHLTPETQVELDDRLKY